MAVTTMDSYTQVGKVENVADEISMISPTNTPMLTMMRGEKVHNTLFSWQEDSLDPPAINAQAEGFTAVNANMVPTVLRSNYTQIFTKTVQVTGTAQALKLYGRGKEYAYQLAKKGKEIKRDVEWALVNTAQVAAAGNDTTPTARTTASVQAQHSITYNVGTVGTSAYMTEAALLAGHQLAYVAGSDPTILMVKPADSVVISNFASSTGRFRDFKDSKKLVNVVTIYESPFGALKVVIDRWQQTSVAFLMDPSMWKFATLRSWQTTTLAKVGDFDHSMLLGEFGTMHKNFADGVMFQYLT